MCAAITLSRADRSFRLRNETLGSPTLTGSRPALAHRTQESSGVFNTPSIPSSNKPAIVTFPPSSESSAAATFRSLCKLCRIRTEEVSGTLSPFATMLVLLSRESRTRHAILRPDLLEKLNSFREARAWKVGINSDAKVPIESCPERLCRFFCLFRLVGGGCPLSNKFDDGFDHLFQFSRLAFRNLIPFPN